MTERCEKCDVEVVRIRWLQHLKTEVHLKNDPNQTIKPFRYTKLCEKCKCHAHQLECSSKKI